MNNFLSFLIIFIALDMVIVVFLYRTFRSPYKKISTEKRSYFKKIFDDITTTSDYKMKLIEYDSLLNTILTERNIQGTLAEQLKQYAPQTPYEDDIWKAHKLRNKVVHEISYEPSKKELQEALGVFQKIIPWVLK